MDVTTGYLLISDTTGYTRFLVESELKHAKRILDSLLAETVDATEPDAHAGGQPSTEPKQRKGEAGV